MKTRRAPGDSAGDQAANQPPPFENMNLFSSDLVLAAAVAREGAGWAQAELTLFGAVTGSACTLAEGRAANEYPPRLISHDRQGNRIDRVTFHPAYHHLMGLSIGAGLHSASWEHLSNGLAPKPGATVARAAGLYMMCQSEPGHMCPVTMTHAAVPSLLIQPELAKAWLPRLIARDYDPEFRPVGEKSGATIGMGLTEKQGGSDVRANTTTAEPVDGGGPGGLYAITGHKWFMSAPMCDAFLVLAQAKGGLSCFLMPRFREDGTLNAIHLQRLKDKIGNRANASSEAEFDRAEVRLIGEEGRGIANIIEMAAYTRFDCALSSAGLMRSGLARALHHAHHRMTFQKKLADHALMRRVLADLAIDAGAMTALTMRIAGAYDRARPGADGENDPVERAWRRIMTACAKFWVCKAGPHFVAETIECIGGNAYVEENGLGILYRETPLNALWEGAGNIICLDVLRALARERDLFDALMGDLEDAAAASPALKKTLAALKDHLKKPDEASARHLVEHLAMAGAASVLIRAGDDMLAAAFIATRLEGGRGGSYGAREMQVDEAALIARASPQGWLTPSRTATGSPATEPAEW